MKETFPMIPGATGEIAVDVAHVGAEAAKAIPPILAFAIIAFIGFRWLRNRGQQKA